MRREGVKNGETLERVKALHESGKSVAWIAKELGFSRQGIYNHLNTLKKKGGSESRQANKGYKKQPKKYIREWGIYNEALVMRGVFTVCFDLLEQEQNLLEEMNLGKVGKKYVYSDALMDICRVMKSGFGLDYRTLEGVCRKLFGLFGISAPDYSTICKRFDTLPAEVKEFVERKEKELAVDGTGRSQSARGHYRESKYEVPSSKYVRVSITLDVKTKEVVVSKTTEREESEIPAVQDAIEDTRNKARVTKVYADKLHDSKGFRGDMLSKGITPVIPARETMSIESAIQRCKQIEEEINRHQGEDKNYTLLGEYQRFQTLIEVGNDYEKWRDENGYGKRAMVENVFSRDTLIYGDRVYSKKISKAGKEMNVRWTMLNLFITLGKAKSRVELNSLGQLIRERIKADRGVAIKRQVDRN